MNTLTEIRLRRMGVRGIVAVFFLAAAALCVVAGFVLGNALLLLLAGVVGATIVGGVLLWPSAATMMVMFIIYSNAAVVAVRYHGVPMVVGAAVPLLLLSPLAYYLVIRRQNLVFDRVLPWIVLFVAAQMVSTVFSDNPAFSLGVLITSVVEGLCLYFLVLNVVRTPQELRRVVWVLLAAGAMMGSLSVLQQVTRTYDNHYWGFAQMSNAAFETGEGNLAGEIEQRRLAGPFGEQNRYAQFMLMLLPLGLFRIWGEKSKWLKLLAIAATMFTALGLVLAFSRGAAVAFLLMLVVMTLLGYIRWGQAAMVACGLTVVAMAVPAYTTRMLSLSRITSGMGEEGISIESADTSVQSRYTETVSAAMMFNDYPLTGVGPGRYPAFYRQYAEQVGVKVKETARQPHILYLGLAAEMGAPGLIAFLAVILVALRNMILARRRAVQTRSAHIDLLTGLLLSIVAYLASGLFLHFAFVRYFWLMMALAGAACRIIWAEAGAAPAAAPRTRRWRKIAPATASA